VNRNRGLGGRVALRITASLIRICNSDRSWVCASPTSAAA